MIAAKAERSRWRGPGFWVCAAGLAAVMLVGGALVLRGPDPGDSAARPWPEMAGRPVMSDAGTPLFVQRLEVTVADWNLCVDAKACDLRLRVRPDQAADTTPATGLSHVDVMQYVNWISRETGHPFRLPSATEWARMAAAVLPEAPDPLFTDPSLSWASAYLIEGNVPRALKPSGSFSTSPEGIADLDGSVWEWTRECYNGGPEARCPAFYVGGEHVAAMSFLVRDPARGGCAVGSPPAHLGMRLVTDRPLPRP